MYGIDIDNRLLDAARCFTRDAGDRFEFHCGTGEQNPLPDAAVDAIITQDTLEHVACPLATLRGFRRDATTAGLTIVHRNVVPLFGLGRRMKGLPALRAAAVALRWLAGVPVLEEALLHRACYVLQKPPATTAASQNPRLMAR